MQINIKTQCRNEQLIIDLKKINIFLKWNKFLMKITKWNADVWISFIIGL